MAMKGNGYNFMDKEAVPDILNASIRASGHVLGKGRHSIVYEGWMTGIGKRVCIKEDMRNPLDEDSYVAIREKVETLRKLNHPSIAGILDYVQDFENKRTYIIMQYVHGTGLNQLLYDRGSFPVSRVLDWTCQILDALRYLHNKRIIHGGILPSSMVLTADAERICLVDFNYVSSPVEEFSADAPEDTDEKPAFRDSMFRYAKDELYFLCGVSRDIYRTGATMYELLTGVGLSMKSGVDTREELIDQAAERAMSGRQPLLKRPDVSLLKERGVPSSVIQVMLKATADEPTERYLLAEEMLRQLRELPKIDERRTAHMCLAVIGGAASAALILLGAFLLFTGLNQLRRSAEMENQAYRAQTAFTEGDYTAALRAVLMSTERGPLDPPVVSEAQAVLADVVSAYDYTAGYKPARSVALSGKPLQAHFSAGGTWIAALTDEASQMRNVGHIYVYETNSGKLACPPLSASPDSDFAFLDDDRLFYIAPGSAVLYSVRERVEFWRLPVEGGSVALTISGDGKKAAILLPHSDRAYLYDTDTGQYWPLFLEGQYSYDSERTPNQITTPFFALNKDGSILGASSTDGSVWLYQITDNAVGNRARIVSSENAFYLRFEGGFCGSDFVLSAAIENKSVSYFNCGVYHLENFDWSSPPDAPNVFMVKYDDEPHVQAEIHVQADENGIYVSAGNSLRYYDAEREAWVELAREDSVIKALRHSGGHLLVLTDAGLALVYREDSAWRTETLRGFSSNLIGISETHLFLANPQNAMLSVLDWWEPGEEDVLLTYAPRNDPNAYYEHQGAALHSDKQTAILYRLDGFRVYSLDDGSFQDFNFPNADNVKAVYYLRNPQISRGEPTEECLQVLHYDGISVYYSPKDGRELAERMRTVWENGAEASLASGDYRLEQMGDGAVLLYRKDALLAEWRTVTLMGISQLHGRLIVTLRNSNGKYYSLLLDENMNVTARIPQPCEALPDGMLAFDDRQGHLLRGALQPIEDLCRRAEKMGM